MKKSSMIFRTICMAVCFALCISVLPAFAEEAAEIQETVTEETADLTQTVEETEAVTDETAEETEKADETEEDEEAVVDLLTAAMRDGGVYITPGNNNSAVFDYDGVRYRVAAATGNMIKVDGFESDCSIEESIQENAKNKLQANGEIVPEAAHSGYFGLAVNTGDVIYRTAVTFEQVYVFSAWLKMPVNGSIADEDRAFNLKGESGNVYVVGYNEIGRETANAGKWQQVLFTFKAPETGVFSIEFRYNGKNPLYMDDIELYEAEVFENPLKITNIVCKEENGEEYNQTPGFSTRNLTHTTTLYNNDEDDVFFNAIMVLYRNDIMVDFKVIKECALVLDETEVTFEISIPREGELNEYKYMVYFISDTEPTHFYGQVPHKTNPYIVSGN